jgi:outer membrane protein assembly factor BamB
VLGLDPQSGKQLWRYPFVTDYFCNIAVPLAVDGQVLISSGENHGSALLNLTPQADGFRVEEAWTSEGPESVLRNEWQTSILRDGYLYGFDNVGSAGPVTHLTCVEAATGKKVWEKLRFGKGNLIAADGKLFMTTHKGDLVIARASPQGYEELGRAKVLETTRQAPSLSDGLLYVRDDRDIVCLDVRAR